MYVGWQAMFAIVLSCVCVCVEMYVEFDDDVFAFWLVCDIFCVGSNFRNQKWPRIGTS